MPKTKNEMDDWLERVKRNDEKQRKGLIKQAKRNVKKKIMNQLIINMLKYQVTDDKIMQYTNINQEELDRIKKKIEAQNRQPLKNKTKNSITKHFKTSKNQALQLHQKYPKKFLKKLLQIKKVNVIIK